MSVPRFQIVNGEGQILINELERLGEAVEGIYRSQAAGQSSSLQTSSGTLAVAGSQFQYAYFKITAQPASSTASYEFSEVIDLRGIWTVVSAGLSDDAIPLYELNRSITVPTNTIVKAWLSDDATYYWFDSRGDDQYTDIDFITDVCPIFGAITLSMLTASGTLAGVTLSGGTYP